MRGWTIACTLCLLLPGVPAPGLADAGARQGMQPVPDSAQFDRIASLPGIDTGRPGGLVYAVVFFDPQCPHCARLWTEALALGERIRLHWVPVALLGPGSAAPAANLLRASDRIAEMNRQVRALTQGQGGDAAAAATSREAWEQVRRNIQAMRDLGLDSVPATLLREPNGRIRLLLGEFAATEFVRDRGAR